MTDVERAIARQPELIDRLLQRPRGDFDAARELLQSSAVDQVGFVARGTSLNAARYGAFVFGVQLGVPTSVLTPSMFTRYGFTSLPPEMLVIAISQSGASADLLEVVETAARRSVPTLAITNEPSSPLAGVADGCVSMQVGTETTIAAITTYTASLAVLALIACTGASSPRSNELMSIPARMTQTLELLGQSPAFDEIGPIDRCPVVGRGFNAATAWEVALKLKELARIPSEAFTVNDFVHGPIVMVGDGDPVLVIAAPGETFDDTMMIVDMIAERGAYPIIIGDSLCSHIEAPIRIPVADDTPEWLSPLTTVMAGQSVAARLAISRGEDPDAPPGLTKVISTT